MTTNGLWGRRTAAALLVLTLLAGAAGCGGSEARKAKAMEKGQAFLAEREYAKARVEFRNALQIDGKDATARTLLGEAAEALGNFEEAVQNYRYALSLDAGQVKARARLGRMMVFGGVPDQALELVAPGLETEPKSADLLTVRGAARLQQGDAAAARADAEAALASEPNHTEATVLLATLLWREDSRDAALALLDRTVKAKPADILLRQIYAQMLLNAEKPDLAEVQLREVVKLEPESQANRYRLAQLYASRRKTDEAVATLREAVERKPDDVDAKLALAGLLAAQRSYEEAEKALLAFVEDAPDSLDLRLGLGRFYEANNRFGQAEQTYLAIVEDAKDKAQGITARDRIASIKIRAGRTDEAVKLLDEVLAKNPSDADALVMRAQIAIQRGDTAAAVTDLRTALRDQPNNLLLTVQLAQAYIRSGDVALAEQTLRQAVQANPRDVRTRLALAQFLVNKGEAQKARPMLEQLVADEPNNAEAVEGLGRLLLALNDPAAALQSATTLQTLLPKSAAGFNLAGVALQALQRGDEARKAFEQARAADPASNDALVALVRMDVADGKLAEANGRLDARLAQDPGNAVLQNVRGDLLAAERRWPEANRSYDAAIKARPAWPQPYRAKATALNASGDRAAAIGVLEGAMEPTGNSADVATDLGTLYVLAGRNDDAIKVFDGMLVRDPRNAIAANNLAMLLANYRSDAASLERAGQLVEPFARSDNPVFLDTFGWVLYKRGRYVEALVPLEKAVAQVPQAQELRYHLGMAQLKAGKTAEARRNLELAVKPGQDYAGLAEAKAALAGL